MGQLEEEIVRCPPPSATFYAGRLSADNCPVQKNLYDELTHRELQADETSDEFYEAEAYLEPFLHQVGGHGSVLTWDRCTVCKPYSWREHRFYEIVPREFKRFVPKYRGVVEVGLIEDDSGYLLLNAEASKLDQRNNSKNGSSRHLSNGHNNTASAAIIRKCESSGSLCKRLVGRIRLKRTGSLELEMFGNDGTLRRRRPRDRCESVATAAAQGNIDEEQIASALRRTGPSFIIDDGGSAVGTDREASIDGDINEPQFSLNPWALKCQTRQLDKMQRHVGEKQKFLLLENLVCDYKLPCILDLKMGFRQHGDDASQAKRDAQSAKCRNTTSAVLGVRMCGMQVYHADSGVFKCCNKYYGRALTVDGFKREISKFWHNGLAFRSDLLPLCIAKLEELHKVIMSADSFRFYSSSLLIIYEGDTSTSINYHSLPQDENAKLIATSKNLTLLSSDAHILPPSRVNSAPILATPCNTVQPRQTPPTNHDRPVSNILSNEGRNPLLTDPTKNLKLEKDRRTSYPVESESKGNVLRILRSTSPVVNRRRSSQMRSSLSPLINQNVPHCAVTIRVESAPSLSGSDQERSAASSTNIGSSIVVAAPSDATSGAYPLVDVRMIDFEHTTCPLLRRTCDDPPHIGADTGYAQGVRNLIELLFDLYAMPSSARISPARSSNSSEINILN